MSIVNKRVHWKQQADPSFKKEKFFFLQWLRDIFNGGSGPSQDDQEGMAEGKRREIRERTTNIYVAPRNLATEGRGR